MKNNSLAKTAILAAGIALACLSAGIARANSITIFTNFGSGGSFDITHSYGVFGGSVGAPLAPAEGMPFTAGTTADLSDAVLALGNYSSPSNTPITLDLEADDSGLPGGILATLAQQGTIPPETSPGLVTFTCGGACPQLTTGTSYWLVAVETDPNSFQAWFFSNSDYGAFAKNLIGSATGPWEIPVGQIAAFQIDGAVGAPAATPEPASWLLLVTGLLGVGMLVKRRMRQV